MASLPIEERLLHYFIAMGAQKTEAAPRAAADLALVMGHEKVLVVILKNDDLVRRGKIFESVLHLASLRNSSHQLYLAAPRLLGATIDAQVFRSQGIGLLLFDDRHIDEAIPPQTIQPSHEGKPAATHDAMILSELATLKSMYSELEKEFARLREEMNSLQVMAGRAETSPGPLQRQEVLHAEPVYAQNENHLPSFFTNNPWLDVLSRRGKEEQPIAG